MTHATLAPSPHLWQINTCITSSVQPPKLSRRQPEEGLTVAWRKPNVSSDVWPEHFEPNRNPPHGAPVGTTVSVVRLKDLGLKSERIKKNHEQKTPTLPETPAPPSSRGYRLRPSPAFYLPPIPDDQNVGVLGLKIDCSTQRFFNLHDHAN